MMIFLAPFLKPFSLLKMTQSLTFDLIMWVKNQCFKVNFFIWLDFEYVCRETTVSDKTKNLFFFKIENLEQFFPVFQVD